jgi:hypothetical protein
MKRFQRILLSTVEGDGRSADDGFSQGKPGTTNVAHNNPDSENELPCRHRPCKLGWLGEVLGSEAVSNTSPHGLRTVPKSYFGSLNRQTTLGIIIAE